MGAFADDDAGDAVRAWRLIAFIAVFCLLVINQSYSQTRKPIPEKINPVSTPAPQVVATPEEDDRNTPSCTLKLQVEDSIGPATLEYITKGIAQAELDECRSILLTLNTPGGNLESTRRIVETIIASRIPFLCLVSPMGGRAASAGAIILLACHVSGAERGTNLGAAMPVLPSHSLPDDVRNKVVQDTVAWVSSLAKLRGRNAEVAEQFVTDAKALDAQSAYEQRVIDTVVNDIDQFLEFSQGREVIMGQQSTKVRIGAIVGMEQGFRNRVLQIITDPEIAYILFMASIGLLLFEITHLGGTIVPGILGAMGLILSLVAFNFLNVQWGSVALMVLGLGLLLAEMFVPSFGALGIGGLVALAAGSFFLYDPLVQGQRLPYSMIAVTVGIIAAAALGLGFLMLKTLRLGKAKSEKALIGHRGQVMSLDGISKKKGMAYVSGEIWKFESEDDVAVGSYVNVLSQEGLLIRVKKIQE